MRFHKSLTNSPKFSVRFLARLMENDKRTTFGKTLEMLKVECGVESVNDLHPKTVKDKVLYASPPANDEGVVTLATELLDLRDSRLHIDGFLREEIDFMLSNSCIS